MIKESSTTTKLRVVFNASAKTASGLSLNDVLKIGPKIQGDLFDIVTRMHTHQIAITADIAKMYRIINIHESQRDFQRIIWRRDRDQEISHFRLNTITYGTASASFLATRTLHQVGLNCKNTPPNEYDHNAGFLYGRFIDGYRYLRRSDQAKSTIRSDFTKIGFRTKKMVIKRNANISKR